MTRYTTDPATQVLCFSWSYDDDPTVHLWHRDHPWIEKSPRPDELLERIAAGEEFEAHNAKFEYGTWNNVFMREFPEIDVPLKIDQMRCSAAKASCLSLPRRLGDALKAIGAPPEFRKDVDGTRLINKLSKPMPKRRRQFDPTVPFKTQMKFEFYEVWYARGIGAVFNSQEGRQIARDIAGGFPIQVTNVSEHVRGALHADCDKGFLTQIGTGIYRIEKIPARLPCEEWPEAIEQAVSDPGPLWCEEEAEHRRNWEYNKQDVRAERYLSSWCGESMSERELEYWLMDFRMNMRGILLDRKAVDEAIDLCRVEVERLDTEMQELTNGQVLGGSKRIPFRAWANDQIEKINILGLGDKMDFLLDTKADTLSFALYGVPTKAQEEAKIARAPAMKEIWDQRGVIGDTLKRAMEICIEVNRSSVAKFRTMKASVCPDDRLHDIMLYNGADRTGRWSGQGVQPHNFVRGYSKDMPEVWETLLKRDPTLVTLVTGDLMLPALAKACRGALIASPGCLLYAADFSAIEARKLAWMASCASQLDLFANEGDPYIDMAAAIYQLSVDATDKEQIILFKKEHSAERQLGKRAVLGLGYAMGWEKFQLTVFMEEGIWLDDEFCKKVVHAYRRVKCPEMPVLWKAMEAAAIAAVQNGGEQWAGGDSTGIGSVVYFVEGRFLHCRLPSGRLLAYLDPEVHVKVNWRYPAKNARGTDCLVTFPSKMGVPMNRVHRHAEQLAKKQHKILTGDPPESFTSPHLSFMGRDRFTRQWMRLGTHGGSLTENADQASSRDLLAEAMWRVDQIPEFDLLLSIHDEVIAEAPIGTFGFGKEAVQQFEAVMSEVPIWAPKMPIAAEGWIGPRLRK